MVRAWGEGDLGKVTRRIGSRRAIESNGRNQSVLVEREKFQRYMHASGQVSGATKARVCLKYSCMQLSCELEIYGRWAAWVLYIVGAFRLQSIR